MTPNLVFRDPYLLHLFGLKDTYSEKDLESAIVAEMQRFIEELGTDFAFLARQKRITIDNEDYYIDLLFYHRRLHCLVAIDLKIDSFKAAHKGQMELPVLSDLQFIPVVVSGDVVHDTIPGVKALQPGSAFAVVFTS